MKRKILIFLGLFSFGSSIDTVPQDDLGAVGPCTSTECEKDELYSYVDHMIRLLFAQDVNHADLRHMFEHRYQELEAFHDEVFSIFVQVQYGARAISNPDQRSYRLEYFRTRMISDIQELLTIACSNHFRYRIWYQFDQTRNTISVRQNITDDDCLCDFVTYEERNALSTPLLILDYRRVALNHQLRVVHTQVVQENVREYFFIPPLLLSEFFHVWLAYDLTRAPNDLNDCAVALFARFRMSIQKILLVLMKRSRDFSVQDVAQLFLGTATLNDFLTVLTNRNFDWLSGNVFLGPPNRGPSNPTSRDEFEHETEVILGERFGEVYELYLELANFVNDMSDASPFDRLTTGFGLFLNIFAVLGRYDITPMNLYGHWERRVRNGEVYWALRSNIADRPRRSLTTYYEAPLVYDMQDNSSPQFSKDTWSLFIAELMKISLEPSGDKSYPWSNDFSCLFKLYLICKSQADKKQCCNCGSFDEFLYSKISRRWDQLDCSGLQPPGPDGDLCRAWQGVQDYLDGYAGNGRSREYLENLATVIRWLSRTIGRQEKVKAAFKRVPTFKLDTLHRNYADTTSLILCRISTAVSVFFLSNPCAHMKPYKV